MNRRLALIAALFASQLAFGAGITGDISGSYSWGTYSTPGLPDDGHAGMAIPLFAGYRFENGFEGGLAATFAFPEVRVRNALSNSNFDSFELGLEGGYLWRNRIGPFLTYFPLTSLSQNSTTRLGTSTIHTDLTYKGQSYGGGLKVYITERESGAVQVGLKFAYLHERYTRSIFESRAENAPDQPAPSFTPSSSPQGGDQNISGDTYQLGLFIGI